MKSQSKVCLRCLLHIFFLNTFSFSWVSFNFSPVMPNLKIQWDHMFSNRRTSGLITSQKVFTCTVRCVAARLLFLFYGSYQVGSLAAALCEQIRAEEGWRHAFRGVSSV